VSNSMSFSGGHVQRRWQWQIFHCRLSRSCDCHFGKNSVSRCIINI